MLNLFMCVICKKTIQGEYGNNPHPLKLSGRCCKMCNIKVVMERIISTGR